MNTKQWTPVLVAFLLAFGSVQAFADGGWHYDEDSDTVIYSYVGSIVSQQTSQPEYDVVQHTGSWHYDEDSDTIVFKNELSREKYARTNPSIDTFNFDSNFAFLDQ